MICGDMAITRTYTHKHSPKESPWYSVARNPHLPIIKETTESTI